MVINVLYKPYQRFGNVCGDHKNSSANTWSCCTNTISEKEGKEKAHGNINPFGVSHNSIAQLKGFLREY